MSRKRNRAAKKNQQQSAKNGQNQNTKNRQKQNAKKKPQAIAKNKLQAAKSKSQVKKTAPPVKKKRYQVWTDGGCAVNPGGNGAYAAVIINQKTGEITELTEGFVSTTNNRMEIMGVIAAMEYIEEGIVTLYADSQYVLKTLNGEYQKKKNTDLWKRLDKALKGIDLHLNWVKGHNGTELNERCDKMCTKSMSDMEHLKYDTGFKTVPTLTPKKKTPAPSTMEDGPVNIRISGGAMAVKVDVPYMRIEKRQESLTTAEYAKTFRVKGMRCGDQRKPPP